MNCKCTQHKYFYRRNTIKSIGKNSIYFFLLMWIQYRKENMNRTASKSQLIIHRKWEKVIQPIKKYKRTMNGLDNPLDFFYQLQKMIQMGYQINVNIPKTLTGAHDNYLQTVFSSQSQEIGLVKLVPSFSKLKFQLQAQKIMKQALQKIKKKSVNQIITIEEDDENSNKTFWFPFVVMKQKLTKIQQNNSNQNKVQETDMSSKQKGNKKQDKQGQIIVQNCYQFKKISNIDTNQIAQVYIYTKKLTASIIRYFHMKNSQSFAYKIENQLSMLTQKKCRSLWKVQQDKQNSCQFIKIMHENKSFYQQTLNLIKLIERKLKKGVNKIVTDWIIDADNKYYLIDVKQVQLIEVKPKCRISKSLTELLSTVTCSMCLQTCHQLEITKVLTNKLISNFYEHLTKRGVNLSFRINFKKITSLSRVCDLCYSLVVAEAQLIQAERKISQICNFASQEQNLPKKNSDQVQSFSQSLKLNQWRLFFYIQNIQEFFNIFNYNKIKENQYKFYLCLQIDGSQTYFELNSPFQNNLSIKAIKIEYFFSQTQDIRQFLHKYEVKIQILSNKNSVKPIAQGCFHGIFNQDYHYCHFPYLQRKYKQILLFNEQSKYSVLGLYVGICNDGMMNINNELIKRNSQVYKPVNKISSCQGLPTEWMQIIYQNYCQKNFQGKNTKMQTSQKVQSSKIINQNKYSINFLSRQQNYDKLKQKIQIKPLESSTRQSSASLYGQKNQVRLKNKLLL